MSFNVAWIKTFALGLISLIAIQSTYPVTVYSRDKNIQDEEIVLAEGTSLNLVTAQEISSKTAKLGDAE